MFCQNILFDAPALKNSLSGGEGGGGEAPENEACRISSGFARTLLVFCPNMTLENPSGGGGGGGGLHPPRTPMIDTMRIL